MPNWTRNELTIQADDPKDIKEFKENENLKILKGRWGPYISLGRKYFKIPKDRDAKKLNFDDVVELIGGVEEYEGWVANLNKKKPTKKSAKKASKKATKKTAKKATKKVTKKAAKKKVAKKKTAKKATKKAAKKTKKK